MAVNTNDPNQQAGGGDWFAQNAAPTFTNTSAAPVAPPTGAPGTYQTGAPNAPVDPTRAAVLQAFAAKGVQPRDEADIQYWVDHINQSGGLQNAGNAQYWTQRMAQGQGGVGDYQERPEAGSTGPQGGGSYNYQTALAKVQQSIGRALQPDEIQGLFSKFGGDQNSTFTDASLAPVIQSLSGGKTPNLSIDTIGPSTTPNVPNETNTPTNPQQSQTGVFQPITPSAYTNYNPGPAPTPIQFVAPTAEQARNTPGYQFATDQANQGLQRSAAAKGGLLSGGALIDISKLNQGLADANYQQVYNNAFGENQAANANQLNAYQASTGANINAGGLNLSGTNQQFQNSYLPTWNAYLSSIGQGQFQQQFGLAQNNQNFNQNLAANQFNLGAQNQGFNQGLASNQFNLGAQNQFWNQGYLGNQQNFNNNLATNQNNYNQLDNNQKTAFDQWYKTTQLGNPGNPYA